MLCGVVYRLRYALSILDFGALALRPFECVLCGPSLLLRLSRDPIGVRCLRCGASAIALSMVSTLVAERPGFRGERVYELSSRGPLFGYLRREVKDLTFSEYFDHVAPGAFRDGVQCQDIQQLTYPDAYFDLVNLDRGIRARRRRPQRLRRGPTRSAAARRVHIHCADQGRRAHGRTRAAAGQKAGAPTAARLPRRPDPRQRAGAGVPRLR